MLLCSMIAYLNLYRDRCFNQIFIMVMSMSMVIVDLCRLLFRVTSVIIVGVIDAGAVVVAGIYLRIKKEFIEVASFWTYF